MRRIDPGERGSVLLHVLMTGALIALISATILRLAMMRFAVTARTTQVNQERRYNETALNLLISQWNSNNKYCASVPGYYNCSGGAGYAPPLASCNCTCSPTQANFPTVTSGGAPPCQLTILSNPAYN